ncbi:hypothetical protein [Nonomuraea antri]|uniref:hypothetical protein n=1 Tax=Nonomuraea antri TaxID=2730852 RepID=UPI001C2C34AA|nr:hypothetical protein [Nonomuraea antri]
MSTTLDMTTMYAMHDALRREAEHLARVTARVDGDPRAILRTATGVASRPCLDGRPGT